MKRLIALATAALLANPLGLPRAYASAAEDCAKENKISVEHPDPASDEDSKTVQSRCKVSGGGSACAKSYVFMWKKFHAYTDESNLICAKVVESKAKLTGVGSTGMGESATLAEEAKENISALKKKQETDSTELTKLMQLNFKHAEKVTEAADEKSKKLVADRVTEIKALKAVTEKDREKFVKKINSLPGPGVSDTAKEELGAAVEIARFQTMLGVEIKGRAGAVEALAANEETNTKNKDKSGSFGLGDAASVLGIATAGLGLMSALKGSAATPAAADPAAASSSIATPSAAAPSEVALAPTEVAGASVGSGTSQGASFAAPADGMSITKLDSPAAGATSVLPAASTNDPTQGDLAQFGGALGGSPFSGSSTTPTSAGSFGASASSRDPAAAGTSAGGAGSASAGAGEGALLPGGGGLPGFAGGSAGGVDTSFKDLFKGGDPFAMPGAGAHAAGAPDLGAMDASALGADGSLAAGNSEMQGGITGINDKRSLFSRVREVHNRSVKRGLITSEAGGKI